MDAAASGRFQNVTTPRTTKLPPQKIRARNSFAAPASFGVAFELFKCSADIMPKNKTRNAPNSRTGANARMFDREMNRARGAGIGMWDKILFQLINIFYVSS